MGLEVRQRCAELCELSYIGKPNIEASDMEVFFVDDPDYFYVIFRGSDEGADWKTNFCFWPIQHMGAKYHRGYFNKMRKHLRNIVGYLPDDKPIIITGHSKGGAEAVLFGSLSGVAPDQIVTFGSPRAIKYADKSLEAFLKPRLTNYKNTFDFITKLPFGWTDYGKQVVKSVRIKGASEHPISVYLKEFF